jgi:hypothetical protein
MLHAEIIQTAIRDAKGRFTGEYRMEKRWRVWERTEGDHPKKVWDEGLFKAQLFLCPLIIWIAMEAG